MAINQNVNINVNANTQDASADINRLENNIKTLDGAINLVGGTIETLAGTLALSGAVTEEQAQQFETAALGAIALADGSKRALEGFKILATETNIAAKAQAAFNKIANANPYVLLASAIAALAAAYVVLRNRQNELNEEVQTTNEKYEEQLELLKSYDRAINGVDERLKNIQATANAYNRTLEEQFEISKQQAENDVKLAEDRLRAAQNALKPDQNQIELRKIQLQQAKDFLQLTLRTGEEIDKETEGKKENNRVAEETVQLKAKEVEFTAKQVDANLKLIDSAVVTQRTLTDIERNELIKRQELRENNAALAVATIDTIQAASLAAFENNKAIASANVLVDAGQAALGILNTSYKNVDPTLVIAYQVAQFALLAATTVQSLRNINSADPNTGGGGAGTNYGAPNTGGFGLSGPGFALGAPQVGGTSGVTTLNAIVLAGDVTSAQAQEAAIRNRRRFG